MKKFGEHNYMNNNGKTRQGAHPTKKIIDWTVGRAIEVACEQ